MRCATPPSNVLINHHLSEARVSRREPALSRPHDASGLAQHVEFLDANLAVGKRIYQLARDFFFKDVVIFQSEGYLQAKAFEDWCMEMQQVITHLEDILRNEFVPFSQGLRNSRPANYYFYLAFRWHYMMPHDPHVCTRVVRLVKRYVVAYFRFSNGDKSNSARMRMLSLAQSSQMIPRAPGAPYFSSPPQRWHHSPPVVTDHEEETEGFYDPSVAQASGGSDDYVDAEEGPTTTGRGEGNWSWSIKT